MKTPISMVRQDGLFAIGALAEDGTYWVFRRRFHKDSTTRRALIARIREAGEIDTAHWERG